MLIFCNCQIEEGWSRNSGGNRPVKRHAKVQARIYTEPISAPFLSKCLISIQTCVFSHFGKGGKKKLKCRHGFLRKLLASLDNVVGIKGCSEDLQSVLILDSCLLIKHVHGQPLIAF